MNYIHLHGIWKLEDEQKEYNLNAKIPGDTYSALYEADIIPDPYYGTNEKKVQWIGKRVWHFSREFEISEDFLDSNYIYINAENLDTFSEIFINEKFIGKTENMFRRYRFDIKNYLNPGINSILIKFNITAEIAKERAGELPFPIPYSSSNNLIPHMNTVRKIQCHAGWDWGPCLMVSGIYGDLSVTGVEKSRIEYVYTGQVIKNNHCIVNITTELYAYRDNETSLKIKLDKKEIIQKINLIKGINSIKTQIDIERPELWWPAGYGSQSLYELTVSTEDQTIKKMIGIRNIEVINENDVIGTCMKFRVNGIDIFCKGANWIPIDAMPGRYTKERYINLLNDTLSANMNMLRVWGGGQYETDIFYELCDSLGILVWQDLMFACSQYPSTDDFIMDVDQEILHQVKRLKDHTCIAIWCGDNEIIDSLKWYEESKNDPPRYLDNYIKLNKALKRTVKKVDPDRTFWPSSPCGGPGNFEDGWHNDKSGDMHFWDLWHSGKSFEAYYDVVPRFSSEFGFQSFPSMETIKTFADNTQLDVESTVMLHHQKNRSGNSIITEMFKRYFKTPEGFKNYLYLSQVQQAIAIKKAVEYWRHLKPICMGTLYWQLNDNWPVISWSSIEYTGKWKQLHYHAKRFYSPVMICAFQTKDNFVEIWGINDLIKDINVTVKIRLFDFEGNINKSWTMNDIIAINSSKKIKEFHIDELFPDQNKRFLYFELITNINNNPFLFKNEYFFDKWKDCELSKAKIETDIHQENKWFKISVKTGKPAFFVTLDSNSIKGKFSDNSFTLIPDEVYEVFFYPDEKITLEQLKEKLIIIHLRDTYK